MVMSHIKDKSGFQIQTYRRRKGDCMSPGSLKRQVVGLVREWWKINQFWPKEMG